MIERSIVVVARKDGDTAITHTVVHSINQIRIEMDLVHFLAELARDMGPTVAVTREQLRKKMAEKSLGVIARMKDSSKYGPLPRTS